MPPDLFEFVTELSTKRLNYQSLDDYVVEDKHIYKLNRSRAEEYYKLGKAYGAEATKTYGLGDGAGAKIYSIESKEMYAKCEEFNTRSACIAFTTHNLDLPEHQIDLHWLFVKEPLVALRARVKVSIQFNHKVLFIIVGKGIHSQAEAKLGAAIRNYCYEQGYLFELNNENSGIMKITL